MIQAIDSSSSQHTGLPDTTPEGLPETSGSVPEFEKMSDESFPHSKKTSKFISFQCDFSPNSIHLGKCEKGESLKGGLEHSLNQGERENKGNVRGENLYEIIQACNPSFININLQLTFPERD